MFQLLYGETSRFRALRAEKPGFTRLAEGLLLFHLAMVLEGVYGGDPTLAQRHLAEWVPAHMQITIHLFVAVLVAAGVRWPSTGVVGLWGSFVTCAAMGVGFLYASIVDPHVSHWGVIFAWTLAYCSRAAAGAAKRNQIFREEEA